MKYLTSREYELELKKIKAQNRQIEMKRNLKAAKVKRFNLKKPNTSKLIVFVVFAICLQILWFSEHMISLTGDTSYMYALIGIPAALIPTILGYYAKASKENQVGGITYDTAMCNLESQERPVFDHVSEDEAVG
nr:MAG: hypothetical protein [Bacteriophage sp.]